MSVVSKVSFLEALREFQLNDNKGVVVPVHGSDDGQVRFRLVRSSDALSVKVKREAAVCMNQMIRALQNPLFSDVRFGAMTILAGDPLVLQAEEVMKQMATGKKELMPQYVELLEQQEARFKEVFREVIDAAAKNLVVVESYRKRIGGRAGAGAFLRDLIEYNPGSFFISFEQREAVHAISQRVFREFLETRDIEAKDLTLADTKELNKLIQKALDEELGKQSFQLKDHGQEVIEKAYARECMKKGPFTAYEQYKAKMAGRLFPTLIALLDSGKIQKGCPIYIVQPGNNDIRNNMHVSILKDLVHEFLIEKGIDADVPIEVHILGLGGHPTTAAFSAHIEVMTARERCGFLKEQDPKAVMPALRSAAQKLGTPVERELERIIANADSYREVLDTVLKTDLTRSVFAKLGNMIQAQPPIYLFKGTSEAETHGALMRSSGRQDNYVLELEPTSKHTGENVEFFVRKIPQGQKPVIILCDASRVGRQVVTFSNQMVDKSVDKAQNWSAVVSPLLDLPLGQYTKASTEDQLYIDTATLFAELARNVAYRTVSQYVDAVPMDPQNYDLLARYYAAISSVSEEEAMQTPISVIMKEVGQEFVKFEDTIPAAHDQSDHQDHLRGIFLRQQARRLITHPPDEVLDEVVEEAVIQKKAQPLKIPVRSIPQSVLRRVGRTIRARRIGGLKKADSSDS